MSSEPPWTLWWVENGCEFWANCPFKLLSACRLFVSLVKYCYIHWECATFVCVCVSVWVLCPVPEKYLKWMFLCIIFIIYIYFLDLVTIIFNLVPKILSIFSPRFFCVCVCACASHRSQTFEESKRGRKCSLEASSANENKPLRLVGCKRRANINSEMDECLGWSDWLFVCCCPHLIPSPRPTAFTSSVITTEFCHCDITANSLCLNE